MEKPVEDFHVPTGFQCKSCRKQLHNEYSKKVRKNFTEADLIKRRQESKRWRDANRHKARQWQRDNEYRKKYGITLVEYNDLVLSQSGVCAICKNSCATGMNLAVDHDHESNRIRALLCKNCNTALGLFREDVTIMKAAIDYLELHSEVKEIA